MAVITNLDTNLIARTKSFNQPIKKSEGVFGSFVGKLRGGIGGIPSIAKAGFGAVVGAASAAAAGVAVLANKISSLSQDIKDFERFGLTASKSFGQFKVLASQAGLQVEDLVDLTKDLSIRIGEANIDGKGEIFDTFKKLGLNVKELKGLSPEAQLASFSEALSKVKNETERLAITDILLSDAGTKAINTMVGGRQAFDDAAASAEKFGLSISNVDATQLQMAEASMAQLTLLGEGLWNQFTVQAAPVLQALVEMFIGAATEGEGFGKVVETAFGILVTGIGFGLNAWNVFIGAMNSARSVIVGIVGGILKGLGKIEAALVYFGGESFDFGVERLGDEVLSEASLFAEKAAKNFSDGFGGKASQEFEDRIKQIRATAKKEAEKPIAPKSIPAVKIKPPKIAQGPGLLDQLTKFGSGIYEQVGSFVAGLKPPEPSQKERDQLVSVAGLAAGSSAALSAINKARRSSGPDLNSTIRQTSKAQLDETKRTNQKLDRLRNTTRVSI